MDREGVNQEMKQIYCAILTFNCTVKKGFFHKKDVPLVCVISDQHLVLAENADEAAEKFKERSEYWNEESYLPCCWGWADCKEHYNYTIVGKQIDVSPSSYFDIDTLKSNMHADEFLEYCRQELIEPKEILE